jgi:hypothetical protein
MYSKIENISVETGFSFLLNYCHPLQFIYGRLNLMKATKSISSQTAPVGVIEEVK